MRDLVSLAGAGAIAQLLTIVSGPLVARLVGPAGRGEIATVTLVTLLSVFLLQGGYPAAITRAVASSQKPARDVLQGQILRGALWCLVPAAGGAGIAWILLRHSKDMTLLVIEAFVMVLLYAWGRLIGAMLAGEGDVRKNSVLMLVNSGGYVALVLIAFAFFDAISPTVIVGFFTASSAWWLVISIRLLRPATGDPSASRATADMKRFARRSYFSGVSVLDGLGLDSFLVSVVLGQVALGLFTVAASVANVPVVVLMPVATLLLGKLKMQASAHEARRVMWQWVSGSILLATVVVVALELAVGPVIRIAFSQEFADAVPLARLLLVGWGLLAVRRVLAIVALAQGRETIASVIEVVATIFLVVITVPLLHQFGAEGAAYALIVAAAGCCVALSFVIQWGADAVYTNDDDGAETADELVALSGSARHA